MWLTSPMVVQVGFLITRTNMQKEKKVRSYTRRTKSGKTVTVKAHTAKYDAAEEMKKMAKKAGAGSELADKKLSAKEQKLVDQILEENNGELDKEYLEAFYPEVSKKVHEAVMKAQSAKSPKEKSVKKVATKATKSAPKADAPSNAISQSDFKAWYHWDMDADPKNAAALRVKKALIAQMGRKGYNAYEKKMIDSYTSRGHNTAFTQLTKELGNTSAKSTKERTSTSRKESNLVEHYDQFNKKRKEGSPESMKITDRIEKTTKTKSSGAMSKSRPTDAPKSQRDSYERHVSSQISGGHQTLSQIMDTLASSGKWSDDEKMLRAAQRIYNRQK